MIYYNQNKYPRILDDSAVREIEERFDIKCLYGGFVGSNVYGTANAASDYDFAFVFTGGGQSPVHIYYNSGNSLADCNGFNLRAIEHNNALCLERVKEFPSFYTQFRRPPQEDSGIEIFRVLCSDYIWDSGYLEHKLPEVIERMEPILILDYCFSRAAGNLEKNLSLDSVLTKSIIRTIFNVDCMLWILKRRTLPYLGFAEMTRMFHDGAAGERIFEILYMHQGRAAGGKAPSIPRDEKLNTYIGDCLKRIEDEIRKIDRSTFKIALDPDCFLGRLVKAGQFGNWEHEYRI